MLLAGPTSSYVAERMLSFTSSVVADWGKFFVSDLVVSRLKGAWNFAVCVHCVSPWSDSEMAYRECNRKSE